MSTCTKCHGLGDCLYPDEWTGIPVEISCPVYGLGPFKTGEIDGHPVGVMSSEERLDKVRSLDLPGCRAALEMPNLQKTVRQAVERRAAKLMKEADRLCGSC